MIYHPIKSSRKFKVFRYSQKSLKISPSTLFSIPLPCVCGPVLAWQSKTNSNYSFTKTAKIQMCLFPLTVIVEKKIEIKNFPLNFCLLSRLISASKFFLNDTYIINT